MAKRLFDILLAIGVVVVLSPALLTIAILVGASSRGPVFFRHERVGRSGGRFHCLKFRTMVADAEDWLRRDPTLETQYRDLGFKLPVDLDPRITTIGKMLRRSQLDELPQLFNVIVGQMSLVGPRPVVSDELKNFSPAQQNRLLSVRPGIFGYWTVLGRDRPNYPKRAQIESSYVENSSLVGDVRLLFEHVPVLLRGQGSDS